MSTGYNGCKLNDDIQAIGSMLEKICDAAKVGFFEGMVWGKLESKYCQEIPSVSKLYVWSLFIDRTFSIQSNLS